MTLIISNIRKRYERSSCSCEGCKACCKYMPGMLIPGDLETIAAKAEEEAVRGDDQEWFRWRNNRTEAYVKFAEEHFQASDGALVVYQRKKIRIPTLTPRLTEKGCVFLDEQERCKIWEYAPFGCSHFSVHDDANEANSKSSFALQLIMTAHETPDDWYGKFWRWLNQQGMIPPPLAERRKKLHEVLERLERRSG